LTSFTAPRPAGDVLPEVPLSPVAGNG